MMNLPAPFLLTAVDLGQAQDPTGLAVVQCTPEWEDAKQQSLDRRYAVRHLERFPASTSYPRILERLVEMFHLPPLRHTSLVFDLTAVGRPIADLFRHSDIEGSKSCVTIVANEAVNDFNTYPRQIAKKDLVGCLQLLLQTGKIKIPPRLDHAETLLAELTNFRIRPGAAVEPGGDWRTGPQDDLVLALAIAMWEGERWPQWPLEPARPIKREPLFPEKW